MQEPESHFNWSEARTVAGITLVVLLAALAIPHARDWIASRTTQRTQ